MILYNNMCYYKLSYNTVLFIYIIGDDSYVLNIQNLVFKYSFKHPKFKYKNSL